MSPDRLPSLDPYTVAMVPAESAILLPARLAAVRRTGLLDTGPEEPFDRLTRLACQLLGTPFGFVTVVDERRSFWKSCIGITSPALADRQNPVEDSFCQYVIAGDEPVIIGDARLDPMTEHNASIKSMGVIAWAGFPVHSPDGQVLGSFCVVDTRPREWSAQDIRTLEVLSQAAGGEVALRIAADDATRNAERYRQLARTLQESLLPPRLPMIDGLEVAAGHRLAGAEAFGDFYDLVQTPTGWAVFLGRPTGQGAQAARTGAVAKYSLRAAAARASSPAIVLTDLDAALHRWFTESGLPGSVAVSYLSLRRTEAGLAVRICTAGHPPATIRRADGTGEGLGRPSSPLGSLPRLSLTIDEAQLGPGDILVLSATEAGARGIAAGSAQQAVDAVLREERIVLALRVPLSSGTAAGRP
jgi:sigma-B regulation protein RsbU (phosphoserine phosphatase)